MLVHHNKRPNFSIKYFLHILQNMYSHKQVRNVCAQINPNDPPGKLKRMWKVLFYGTDSFSHFSLKTLNMNRISGGDQQLVQDLEVVCHEANNCVRSYAESENLCIHSWPYEVPVDTYDIGIVVSFGHLIPSKSILACRHGMINVHPSLLPRWRGAAPISHCILNGDIETGVTIIQIAPKKFDIGNILMQQRFFIPQRFTANQLKSMMGSISANMLLNTLKDLPVLIKNSYPQSCEGVTYAHKIVPSMGHVNWHESTSCDVDRKMRAFKDNIKVYTFWKEMKIILLDILCSEEVSLIKLPGSVPENISPGFLYVHKKRNILFVKCKDGWTGIRLISIPITGTITGKDFYNGFLSKVPSNQHYFLSSADANNQLCNEFQKA